MIKINDLSEKFIQVLEKENIKHFLSSQEKALDNGLIDGKNLLVCTPTASGKTMIAEIAIVNTFLKKKTKAIYLVPLIALAGEKYKDFKRKYSELMRIALSVGDFDCADPFLADYDWIICTVEKLDSLIRHKVHWLKTVGVVVVDEIHLLNDVERGPVLEVMLTLLKQIIPQAQFIGLSATIGNPKELADWLNAELIVDNWRPIPLHKGTILNGKILLEE